MTKFEKIQNQTRELLHDVEERLANARKELDETVDTTTREMWKRTIEFLKGEWKGYHEVLYYMNRIENGFDK